MLIDALVHNQKQINGKWYICKPVIAPFIVRLRNAFLVISGKAEAVTFYGQPK